MDPQSKFRKKVYRSHFKSNNDFDMVFPMWLFAARNWIQEWICGDLRKKMALKERRKNWREKNTLFD